MPIDVRRVDEFNPLEVPTLGQLLEEIDAWDGPADDAISDWQKTSLRPYVELFERYVEGLLKDEKSEKRAREEGESMEF